MLNISTGCEPNFRFSYTRKTESLKDEEEYYQVYAAIASEYLKNHTGKLPRYFVTSDQIYWKDRIDIQAILQNSIDTGISSTINLPKETTIEEIEELYLYAWKKGLKGVTIFRDGGKRLGILTTSKPENDNEEELKTNKYNYIVPTSRKKIGVTTGKTYCKKCACGTLYITVNCDDEDNIVETFIHTSKGGICQANIGAITRMASVALRSGVKVEEIADQLKGITCPACIKLTGKGKEIDGISCPDIFGKTLIEFYNNKNNKKITNEKEKEDSNLTCPECGTKLIHAGGCVSCTQCGWSKCG